jgi:AraC-like DNA-binding protein
MSDSAPLAANRLREVADLMHIRLFIVHVLRLASGNWNTDNVQSPFWRFYQNADAGGYLDLPDGARLPLSPGRLYFVPAGVRFSCGNDAPFRHFYIHFDVVGLPSLTMRALFDGPVALAACPEFEARVTLFAASLATLPTLDIGGQCRAKALVYEGLARYLDGLPSETRERGLRQTAALEPVAPAIRHIESHLSEPLTIPGLAALCCLGPDHFARRFKECVGQTFGAYLRERRVMRAAQRLRFSDDSLDAIAHDCGFGNRNYMTRVFSATLGVPPAAYRKAGRAET